MKFKKALMAVAIVASFGVSASASSATYDFNINALFTFLAPNGTPLQNTQNPYYSDKTWYYGTRTPIKGTLRFDSVTGQGSGTIVPFHFFSSRPDAPWSAKGISFQAIGNGAGGPGTLLLGNMLFDWNGNNGIPVSMVMDAAGLFGAMGAPGGLQPGQVITGVGALPASNMINKGTLPIGAVPIATTTWNTTTVPGAGMGSNPSGQLPLIADSVGGSPAIANPFPGYNINIDVTSMTVVPLPAAGWLLGSGLIGLASIARRRKAAQPTIGNPPAMPGSQ